MKSIITGSSETPSTHDQTTQSSLLAIKRNQNLVIDLDMFKYDNYLLPIVEFFKYYPLLTALKKKENVSMFLLSKAYSFASYIKEEQRITFEIHNRQTSITKTQLCSFLGLPQTDDMINLDSVTNTSLLEMFCQMWYKETLNVALMLWKPNLPPQRNGLFTLLFKAFSD
ncbi:unnamed protein product [Lactuca saligna]|uniref:Uncharacterized protein n=1 Tax=Lactuca saligna TaxID=75948 RepID=A0AA35YML0_LACSI|nr:unnamed protein product [Lactuca saligna]